mgnify:CR=1 FL=1
MKINPFSAQKSFATTNEAALFLCLKPQTLRKWAMDGSGPIQPIKIGNRLRWNIKELMALMEVN